MAKFTKLLIAFLFIWLLASMDIPSFGQLNAQTNSFTAGACIGASSGSLSRLYYPLVEDFNGDNYDDIIVIDEGSVVWIYKNDGMGGFDAGTQIFTGGVYGSMSAGDLDGDGDLDFVHRNGKAYLNDGTGVFTQYGSGPIFTGTGNVVSTAIADFNGDGKQDIFFLNSSSNAGDDNQVWVNTGTMGNPSFALQNGWDNQAIGPRGTVSVGDIDGDNDIDIINGNSSWNGGVYKNDGNGNFSQSQTISVYSGTAILKDWDGDNDLDFFACDRYNNSGVRLGKNDGTGTFETPPSILIFPLLAFGSEIADLNNDGTPDVLDFGRTGKPSASRIRQRVRPYCPI